MEKGNLTMRLFFIVAVLSHASGLDVRIPQREYEVLQGNNVTMVCKFVPAQPVGSSNIIITWSMEADNPTDSKIIIATYYKDVDRLDIKSSYQGRAKMTIDIPGGQSTLTLSQVTMKESRLWQCRAQIPGDDEGKTSDTTILVVLAPPSVPDVKLQGQAEYWANINLTCVSEEGSPKPIYSWKVYDTKNNPRPLPAKTTEKNGVLSLFNISMETSGFFVCTATNKMGSASYNFTLAVMPSSMKIGSTLAIVGGVLAGVLVLAIVIYCCKKKRNNDKQNKGVPEVEFFDNPKRIVSDYHDDISEGKPEGSLVLPNEMREEVDRDDRSVRTDRSDGFKEKPDDNVHVGHRHGYGGSHDRLDDPPVVRYSGSRERLDDPPVSRIGGSRDHLDDQRDRYGGSRDRLDDQRDRYGGSRDRLDDQRNLGLYGGSRDRIDNKRDRYGGSRDRLDDKRDLYGRLDDLPISRHGGSRDRLDDPIVRYSGSRERLDDTPVDRYRGSRERLDDPPVVRTNGSRDRLDNQHNRHGGSRDRLDDPPVLRHGGSQDCLDNYR